MNVVRTRAVASIAIGAALLFAACGGSSSSSKSATTSPPTDGNAATTTTGASSSGGNGNCYTTPGKQKARVRFVNLFTNPTYPSRDIDVWQGFSGT